MAIRSAFDSVEKIAFATFRRGDRIVCPYPRTRETKMYFRMCMPVNRVDYIQSIPYLRSSISRTCYVSIKDDDEYFAGENN